MRHLRKFEDYDFGPRFTEEEIKPIKLDNPYTEDEEDEYREEDFSSQEEWGSTGGWEDQSDAEEECKPCNPDESESDSEEERTWGDENELRLERFSSFRQFEAKKQDKGVSYKKSGLKHPEKADLDKNKKISGYEKTRGKAIQDAVQDEKEEKGKGKKEEKGDKGLTAAQKKLPEGLRKAIEAKNKKK